MAKVLRRLKTLRHEESKRRVSAVDEALLFAAGGDYTPTTRASQCVISTPGGSTDTGNVAPLLDDEDKNNLMALGQIRRQRGKTLHKIGKLKKSIKQNTVSDTEIEMQDLNSEQATCSDGDESKQLPKTTVAITDLQKESEVLKEELDDTNATLQSLQNKIADIPTIRAERKRARNSTTREQFIKDIFASVRKGDLDSLKVRVAALDLETPNDAGLKELTEPSSHLPILHVALMCDQEEIVKFLIEHCGRDLTTQSVASGDCDKLTAFYIAVMHGNFNVVRLLLDSFNDSAERAQVINEFVIYTTEKGVVVEEWALFNVINAYSVKIDKIKELFEYLVENGADLGNQNSDGNSLLHYLVMQSGKDNCLHIPFLRRVLSEIIFPVFGKWWERKMMAYKIRWALGYEDNRFQAMKYLLGLKNKENKTPFTLAAELDSPLFVDFIQMENVMRFPDPKLGRFFNKTQTYDVTESTSLDHAGSYKTDSVLHIIAHNHLHLSKAKEKEDLLMSEPLHTITKLKWSVYRFAFYLLAALHITHMITFTAVVFAHNKGNRSCMDNEHTGRPTYEIKDHFIYIGFILLPILYIVSEIVDHCTVRRTQVKCPVHGNLMFRMIAVVFSVNTIVWYVLHEFFSEGLKPQFVSITLLLGWVFVIFFTRGIVLPWRNVQIGMFSSMIHRMFFFDVIPFAVIAFLMLISFSTAFHVMMLHDTITKSATTESTYGETLYLMVKYICGLPNPQDYKLGHDYAKILLNTYGLITVVLLINMLIAAMNTSYEMIKSSKFNPIYRQRLSIMLLFERRLPKFIRKMTQSSFTVKTNPRTTQVEMFLRITDH